MPVLLILGAVGALIAKLIETVTPEATKALKDLVRTEGDKINLAYPELGQQLQTLVAQDPLDLNALSAFSVRLHDFIRREYPPDVSGDQSEFEDRVHRDPVPGTEAAPTGLPSQEK